MAANLARFDEIRSAVKSKVLEFDAYIDDELVEYIMVMIANKKSRDKMTEDLELFLGDNSILFVQWLFDYMENESKEPTAVANMEKNEPKVKVEEEAVISIQPEPADFEEIGVKGIESVIVVPPSVETTASRKEPVLERPIRSNKRKLYTNSNRTSSNGNVKTVDKKVQKVTVVAPPTKKIRSERDVPSHRERPKSSVVKITRPRPQISTDKQASGKLLSRAVKDAFHSLSHKEANTITDREKIIEQSDKHIPEKISEEEKHRQLVRQYDEMRQKLDEEEENLTFLDSSIKVINNKNVDLRNIVQSLRKDKAQHIHANVSKLNRELTVSIVNETAVNKRDDKFIVEEFPSEDRRIYRVDVDNDNALTRKSVKQRLGFSSKNGKAVDTPNNKSIFERLGKVEVDSEDANESENSDKVQERCRFWPICKNGDQCPYLHPTIPCRNFPTCTFGNKCLYLHPKCKYDGKCSRPSCPYIHFLPQILNPFVEAKPIGNTFRPVLIPGNMSKYTWKAPSAKISDDAPKSSINKSADIQSQPLS